MSLRYVSDRREEDCDSCQFAYELRLATSRPFKVLPLQVLGKLAATEGGVNAACGRSDISLGSVRLTAGLWEPVGWAVEPGKGWGGAVRECSAD